MSTIVNPTTDKAQVPTSEDINTRLFIYDHGENADEAGRYLTAYTRTGDDWTITVDYFEDERAWAVYGRMGDDDGPLTTDIITAFLAAHEDAQGVTDHLNTHPVTTRLNEAAEARQYIAKTFTGRPGYEVII